MTGCCGRSWWKRRTWRKRKACKYSTALHYCIKLQMYYHTFSICLSLFHPIQGIPGPKGRVGDMGIKVAITYMHHITTKKWKCVWINGKDMNFSGYCWWSRFTWKGWRPWHWGMLCYYDVTAHYTSSISHFHFCANLDLFPHRLIKDFKGLRAKLEKLATG